MQSLPFIVLGAGLTIGIALIIGGCVAAHNAWALLLVIPTLFAALIGMVIKSRASYDHIDSDECISIDLLIWALMVCVVSLFALPAVLYHVDRIGGSLPLTLDCIGCVFLIAGVIGVQVFSKDDDFGM